MNLLRLLWCWITYSLLRCDKDWNCLRVWTFD